MKMIDTERNRLLRKHRIIVKVVHYCMIIDIIIWVFCFSTHNLWAGLPFDGRVFIYEQKYYFGPGVGGRTEDWIEITKDQYTISNWISQLGKLGFAALIAIGLPVFYCIWKWEQKHNLPPRMLGAKLGERRNNCNRSVE